MSVKSAALRALVLERLAVAADEIFALFERTFAQYEEEVLRSKLMHPEPRDVLYKEDIQTVTVGVDIGQQVIKEEPVKIKQEANAPIELQCPPATLKSEEQDAAEKRQASPGEEPGCSSDLISDNNGQSDGSSDTDDFFDWGFLVEKATKHDAGERNASRADDSAENGDHLHSCTQCSKSFQSNGALKKHLKTHAKDAAKPSKPPPTQGKPKPHRCPICKRSFTRKLHMNDHMRTHTGERPFSCSECDVTFRHQYSLMRHVLTKHSDDKPYRCSVCQKGFVQKGHYEYHMKRHAVEKTVRCAVCGQSYDSQSHLQRHMSVHGADAGLMS